MVAEWRHGSAGKGESRDSRVYALKLGCCRNGGLAPAIKHRRIGDGAADLSNQD